MKICLLELPWNFNRSDTGYSFNDTGAIEHGALGRIECGLACRGSLGRLLHWRQRLRREGPAALEMAGNTQLAELR